MDHALVGAASIPPVPGDESGAPAWLVGVILLGLTIGVGWWLLRIATQRVSDEVVEPKQRSRKNRASTEADHESSTLVAAAGLDEGFGTVTDNHVPGIPPVAEDGRTVQDRLAALDQALDTGRISGAEHHVLRAALLEDFPGGWTRPTPAPPVE